VVFVWGGGSQKKCKKGREEEKSKGGGGYKGEVRQKVLAMAGYYVIEFPCVTRKGRIARGVEKGRKEAERNKLSLVMDQLKQEVTACSICKE